MCCIQYVHAYEVGESSFVRAITYNLILYNTPFFLFLASPYILILNLTLSYNLCCCDLSSFSFFLQIRAAKLCELGRYRATLTTI